MAGMKREAALFFTFPEKRHVLNVTFTANLKRNINKQCKHKLEGQSTYCNSKPHCNRLKQLIDGHDNLELALWAQFSAYLATIILHIGSLAVSWLVVIIGTSCKNGANMQTI